MSLSLLNDDLETYLEKTDFLSSQFKEKRVIQAFRKALLSEIHDLLKTTKDLLEKRSLEEAEGVQADLNGEAVGLKRPTDNSIPISDEFYKILTLAQIGVNNADSSLPSIKRVLSLLLSQGSSENIDTEVFDTGRGGLIFEFRGELSRDLRDLVISRLAKIVRAGFRVSSLIKLPDLEEETFRFSSDERSIGPGFGGKFSEDLL